MQIDEHQATFEDERHPLGIGFSRYLINLLCFVVLVFRLLSIILYIRSTYGKSSVSHNTFLKIDSVTLWKSVPRLSTLGQKAVDRAMPCGGLSTGLLFRSYRIILIEILRYKWRIKMHVQLYFSKVLSEEIVEPLRGTRTRTETKTILNDKQLR